MSYDDSGYLGPYYELPKVTTIEKSLKSVFCTKEPNKHKISKHSEAQFCQECGAKIEREYVEKKVTESIDLNDGEFQVLSQSGETKDIHDELRQVWNHNKSTYTFLIPNQKIKGAEGIKHIEFDEERDYPINPAKIPLEIEAFRKRMEPIIEVLEEHFKVKFGEVKYGLICYTT